MSVVGALWSYNWRMLRAFLRRDLPATEEDVNPWLYTLPFRLWDVTCTAAQETFHAIVTRSPASVPVVRAMRGWRVTFLILPFAWPAIAGLLALRYRGQVMRQWRHALRRPDLYLGNPMLPLTDAEVDQRRADLPLSFFLFFDYARRGSASYRIDHKPGFLEAAMRAGLPVPRGYSREQALAEGGEFIAKPPHGQRGEGVRLVRTRNELHALSSDTVLQERLRNHPAMLDLIPDDGPLATLRVITTLDGEALQPICESAHIKVGLSGVLADNIALGAAMAELDLQSGELLPGVSNARVTGVAREDLPLEQFAGARAPFVGRTLPGGLDALACCVRAHRLLAPDVASIGWDVALCERGPVLIESNLYAGTFELMRLNDSYHRTNRTILRLLTQDSLPA